MAPAAAELGEDRSPTRLIVHSMPPHIASRPQDFGTREAATPGSGGADSIWLAPALGWRVGHRS